jgi:hypothetical protein
LVLRHGSANPGSEGPEGLKNLVFAL